MSKITAKIVEIKGFGVGQGGAVNIYELSRPVALTDLITKQPYEVNHIQVSHSYSPLATRRTLVCVFDFPSLQPCKWDSQVGSSFDYVPLEQACNEFLEWANAQ